MTSAHVYVPKGAAADRLGIDPGSGIVGLPFTPSLIEVYYEGNRLGAVNIVTFADRCHHAFDRMRTRYPTVARATVSVEDLTQVGTFFDGHGVDVTDAEGLVRLAEWLGIGHRERIMGYPNDAGPWIVDNSDRLHAECRLNGGR